MGERDYVRVLKRALEEGERVEGRNGPVLKLFGERMEFDLREGFPLLSTKRVHWRSIAAELTWFLSGSTNIKDLKSGIWNEWADPQGELGPIYGAQWRGAGSSHGVDQIKESLERLKDDPHSRRHVVVAWNPADLSSMALPPCHCLFQWGVESGRLSLQLYQRSGDLFLGVPFNIASYALLIHMFARHLGLEPGRLIHVLGDAHLYANHVEQAREQVGRQLRPLPKLRFIRGAEFPWDHTLEDFMLEGYDPWPALKGDISP